jgi:hypothetical protein
MNDELKTKVFHWITEKIRRGETSFDVVECTKEIGLDPTDKGDVERVDQVFQRHEKMANEIVMYRMEDNN